MGDFDAVYAREDVDAVGAEDGDGEHVEVVEEAELEQFAEVGAQGDGDHNVGYAEIDEVDDEEGNAGDAWDEELVAPADVEKVVANAEDGDGLDGENCGEIRCKLSFLSMFVLM